MLDARLPDPARSRLRAVVAAVDAALSQLSPAAAKEAASTDGLAEQWHALVELLALGPEPTYRECPVCGNVGMRAATVCGHCWTRLPRLDESAVVPAPAPSK